MGTTKTPAAVHPLTAEHAELAERALQNIGLLRDEHTRMRAALERIAQFDAYEPAGPAAQEAREVLASLTT